MKRNIIVIGSSAGGVTAIPRLLSSLAEGTPAAFFVTLHVAPDTESYMPALIARQGNLPAEHPRDGTAIRQGRVYVAPPDFHLILERNIIRLSHGPKENRHRPAIDLMFRSAAEVYRERVVGVLLTGNLDDGVAGLQEIQHRSGLTVVQDPSEALFPQMPCSALKALEPNYCLPLKQIEQLLARLPLSSRGGRNMKAKNQAGKISERPIATAPGNGNGTPVAFVCPECQGPLWELRDGELLNYECLVGHRYSLESLLHAHSEELEAALWAALRAFEERIRLQRRLADQSQAAGRTSSGKLFSDRASENLKHARLLRGILEERGRGKG